jgi:AcrR family transcriptional regulator
MTQAETSQLVRTTARHLFASKGYEGVSMRILAEESGVGLSSIYHFFEDKDALLKSVYEETNTKMGAARRELKPRPTAEQMLTERISFQFDHIEDIVFVLKYYMHYRQDFTALPTKTLPHKSALHIEEVLHKGLSTGEFSFPSELVPLRSKSIAHMINGFLMEYYPDVPRSQERKRIIAEIVNLTMPALL